MQHTLSLGLGFISEQKDYFFVELISNKSRSGECQLMSTINKWMFLNVLQITNAVQKK